MSRAVRLAELLKKEIGNILISKVNDQRIGFVSITDVEVSEDLSFARIFVSFLGPAEEKKRSLRGLISAIPFIRKLLAERIEMRIVPNLRFIQDDSLEIGNQRLELLNKLAEEREKRDKQKSTAAPTA
jgi:ribosome-binding factor A